MSSNGEILYQFSPITLHKICLEQDKTSATIRSLLYSEQLFNVSHDVKHGVIPQLPLAFHCTSGLFLVCCLIGIKTIEKPSGKWGAHLTEVAVPYEYFPPSG